MSKKAENECIEVLILSDGRIRGVWSQLKWNMGCLKWIDAISSDTY